MIKGQQTVTGEHFINVRQPGMKGWNTIVDVHDIDDKETPDLNNVWFDGGVIGPRPGSALFANRPTGETGTPLQPFVAKTSDGVEYLIVVYTSGTNVNNFYIYDVTNLVWIPISGSYAPTFTITSIFGRQTWDGGYSDDRLYLCNGTDDAFRLRLAIGHLSVDAASTDTTITLSDATRFYNKSNGISSVSGDVITISGTPYYPKGQMLFYHTAGSPITGLTNDTVYYALPQSGDLGVTVKLASSLANARAGTAITLSGSGSGAQTLSSVEPIVLYDGTTAVQALYHGVSGNVITLTAALGTAVGNGAAVTYTLSDRISMSKGKVMSRWQSRLMVANFSPGGESTMSFSRIGDPEDFVSDPADVASGGTEAFIDGFGGITDIKDFGEFLLVGKNDVEYRFSFILNGDLSAKITQVVPLISGKSMGPISTQSSIKALNSIYYPTLSNGFIQLSPLVTGSQSSSGVQVLSYNINNYIQRNINFNLARGVFYNNKLIWTVSTGSTSNMIFMYDMIRNSWTKWDNWNAVDMFVMGTKFYYLSAIDGKIYQGLVGYTDNSTPYNVYFYTKLNNYGEPALPKTMDAIYVEGYMTQSTRFYVDVYYNEKGKLSAQTYEMAVSVSNFNFTNVTIDALGQLPINQGILDSLIPSQIQDFGYFRCYLSVPNAFGLYATQLKFYSKDANAVWFITGYGANPQLEPVIPPFLRIESISSTASTAAGQTGQVTSGSTSSSEQFVYNEVPSGLINGVNVTYTLAHSPVAGSLRVYVDGVRFNSSDFTNTGTSLVVAVAPTSELTVDYNYI